MRKFMVSTGIGLCLMGMVGSCFAQPKNDLYLFSLAMGNDGEYHAFAPKYLSGFNAGGSTVEPSFTSSGDLIVSARKTGDSQYDIWQLSLVQHKVKRITSTKASEYYPRISPDGQNLWFLRKAPTEMIDLQLIQIGLNTSDEQVMTTEIHDVGNYAWISKHELGLYRVEGEENSLNYMDLNDHKMRRITTSVGKTILADQQGRLVYVHKFNPDYWYIKKYNPASSTIEVVTTTPGRVDDFALAPDGTYFIGLNSILYCMKPSQQMTWHQVEDLAAYGIRFISGLAISDDGHQLVIVASNEKP